MRDLLVISDVDDTIKRSNTPQCGLHSILFSCLAFLCYAYTLFALPPRPVPRMPEFYNRISMSNPKTRFIYVSGGTSILRSHVERFIYAHYPHGEVFLNNRLCFDLGRSLFDYKLQVIENIFQRWPQSRAICVGDSRQFDAEIYIEMYRRHPSWIAKILIRDVSPGKEAQWQVVFEKVPRRVWCVAADVERLTDTYFTEADCPVQPQASSVLRGYNTNGLGSFLKPHAT